MGNQIGVNVSVSTSVYEVIYTKEQERLLKSGYKETLDHEIYEPDTVWFTPKSKVYHVSDGCRCGSLFDATPVHESEALALGLRRCNNCDWGDTSIPQAGRPPRGAAQPVSVAIVRPSKEEDLKPAQPARSPKPSQDKKLAPRPTDAAGIQQAALYNLLWLLLPLLIMWRSRPLNITHFLFLFVVAFFVFKGLYRAYRKTDECIKQNIEYNEAHCLE